MPDERTQEPSEENETGEERQERIQREQHRPEQNDGYDEAVRQPGLPSKNEVPPDQRPRRDL